MATKYHNSPNGPRLCKAKVQECPYALAGGEHYTNFAEAQAAYETEQSEKYGQTVAVGKSDRIVQEAHRAYYTARDRGVKKLNKTNNRLKARIRLAKASPEVKQAKADFNMLMNDVQSLVNDSEKKANQFKNRLIAHYRVSRLKAKTFINTNREKYRKLETGYINFIQKTDDKLTNAALTGLNKAQNSAKRLRSIANEGTNRLKAASSHQKAALKALRESSPEAKQRDTIAELTKLSEATKGRISPEIVDEYFKGLNNVRKARHRAEVETVDFAKPGQGRRRANINTEEEITI